MLKASFLTNKLFDKGKAMSFLFRSHTQNASFPSNLIPYRKLYSRNILRYLIIFVIKISGNKEAWFIEWYVEASQHFLFCHNNSQLLRWQDVILVCKGYMNLTLFYQPQGGCFQCKIYWSILDSKIWIMRLRSMSNLALPILIMENWTTLLTFWKDLHEKISIFWQFLKRCFHFFSGSNIRGGI